jgi:Leucine-rich repeat (LRR) protein
MFRFKFLLVSCLIFNLNGWSDGKVLTCSYAEKHWWNNGKSCNFRDAVLNSGEEASFIASNFGPGETVANITELDFQTSTIHYVPASIFTYFIKLLWLQISSCNLQEIRNNTFENATELEYLNFYENQITTLKADTFRGATLLESIDFRRNQISHIDVNAFRGLSNLRLLDLGFNKIVELDGKIFAPVNQLVYLGLNDNSIRALDKDIFRNLSRLTDLYLAYNSLESLDGTLLLNNTKLSYLDLSHNRIRALSSKMFQHLVNAWFIDLSSNVCTGVELRYIYSDDMTLPNPANDEILLAECNNNYVYKRVGRICHRILKYFPEGFWFDDLIKPITENGFDGESESESENLTGV